MKEIRRNFLCDATGVNCTNPRCKRGSCIMEQEAVAKAVTMAAIKDANAGKAGRGKSVDVVHARRILAEVASTSTTEQIRKRLDWDKEFMRMALAVPEVRARYDKIVRARKHLQK
jgi:hypothetical protein